MWAVELIVNAVFCGFALVKAYGCFRMLAPKKRKVLYVLNPANSDANFPIHTCMACACCAACVSVTAVLKVTTSLRIAFDVSITTVFAVGGFLFYHIGSQVALRWIETMRLLLDVKDFASVRKLIAASQVLNLVTWLLVFLAAVISDTRSQTVLVRSYYLAVSGEIMLLGLGIIVPTGGNITKALAGARVNSGQVENLHRDAQIARTQKVIFFVRK
jgi:hypothetical protein